MYITAKQAAAYQQGHKTTMWEFIEVGKQER